MIVGTSVPPKTAGQRLECHLMPFNVTGMSGCSQARAACDAPTVPFLSLPFLLIALRRLSACLRFSRSLCRWRAARTCARHVSTTVDRPAVAPASAFLIRPLLVERRLALYAPCPNAARASCDRSIAPLDRATAGQCVEGHVGSRGKPAAPDLGDVVHRAEPFRFAQRPVELRELSYQVGHTN